MLKGNWNYPTAMKAGAGRLADVPALCREYGIVNPLIVTDPGLRGLDFTGRLLESCRVAGLGVAIFSDIKPNPTGSNVESGTRVFVSGGHDGVIAIGGGSAMDAGKAIAFMAHQERPIWDFEDVGDNFLRAKADAIRPVIAIPTTAGTGSEVGRASIITDEKQLQKKIIFHPRMLPVAAVLDPELTVGLPPMLTAATGMDALSHSLEALCSPVFHPIAEGMALEGIRLVFENLERVVTHGNDLDARLKMLTASSMGAAAFQKGLGAMHALAHPLGAVFDAHHGMLNAVLMPYVLERNSAVCGGKLDRAARVLGGPYQPNGDTPFIQSVLKMRAAIGIPHSLSDMGLNIDEAAAEKIAGMAVLDPSASTNPIPFTAEEYRILLLEAAAGQLKATI